MNELINLLFKDAKIIISVPNFENKINYYYPPLPELNRFDEGSVYLYLDNEKKVLLLRDILQVFFIPFYVMLKKGLSKKLQLPIDIHAGDLGLYYNNYMEKIYNDDDFKSEDLFGGFLLWSGINIQTWLYNVNDRIYIEISPSYKWHLNEPEKNEKFIAYKDFQKKYKPIAVLEISKEKSESWLKQCKKICSQLEIAN